MTIKVLFNQDFKALRAGKFVEANENAGEFTFELGQSKLPTQALLNDIAEVNKIEIAGRPKVAEYFAILLEKINETDIPKVNKMTETNQVQEIVNAGVAAGKSQEEMAIQLIQECGLGLKAAGKALKEALEAGGHAISAKARKEQINEILDGNEFSPETYEEVVEAATKIAEAVADTTEKQALSAIRAWAKANEVELPAKPKGTRSGGGAKGPRGSILGTLLAYVRDENREATSEEIDAKVAELKPEMKDAQRAKYVAKVVSAVEFAKSWAA